MVFWARAFTPLIPLCPSPKTKKKFVNFLKQVFLSENKKKRNTSANTAYLVTAFIQKPPPIFASATANIRYAETLYAIQKIFFFL